MEIAQSKQKLTLREYMILFQAKREANIQKTAITSVFQYQNEKKFKKQLAQLEKVIRKTISDDHIYLMLHRRLQDLKTIFLETLKFAFEEKDYRRSELTRCQSPSFSENVFEKVQGFSILDEKTQCDRKYLELPLRTQKQESQFVDSFVDLSLPDSQEQLMIPPRIKITKSKFNESQKSKANTTKSSKNKIFLKSDTYQNTLRPFRNSKHSQTTSIPS